MAMYTMELREIIEQATQFESMSHKERIEKGMETLFDFDYPIFDEKYRNVFQTNFIRNFYMREIGFETEGLFKFQLETWLLINMPYYNKLFESELLKYDPLTNTKYEVTHNKTNDKKQNNLLNKNQNDTTTTVKTDSKDIIQKEDNLKTHNENRDVRMNEDNSVNENVNKDIVRNDTINKTGLETEKTLNKTDNDGSTKTITNNENNSTIKNVTDVIDKKENVFEEKTFDRDLTENTPDGRLAITTQDGKGVIEYASKIDEKRHLIDRTIKENNTSKNTGDVTGKDTLKGDENSTVKNLETFNGDKTINNVDDENVYSNINDSTIGSKSGNTTMTKDDDVNATTKDLKNLNVGEKFNSSLKNNFTGNQKENLDVTVNDIEDFIQYNFGKTGSVSFPELVKEYRDSLLRIEKQIFREMNELFMLVY